MRRLFKKMFGFWHEKNARPQSGFLSPVSVLSIYEVYQRSIVGWLACRIARFLEYERENAEALFYLSLARHSIDHHKKNEFYPLFLAECVFSWIKGRENVREKITELNLAPNEQTRLMQIVDEIQDDLFNLLSPFVADGRAEHHAQTADHSRAIWEVYRDVIYAATQRKFLLISAEEIPQYKTGNLLCEAEIKERSDIPKARELAKNTLLQIGTSPDALMNQLLLISEAITNVLKHAKEGKMTLFEKQGVVRVVVEDHGPGFSLKDLPNATLLAGYSTKKSLGQGFPLMLKKADKVVLSTSPTGSTIILIFNENEKKGGAK